MNYNLVTQRGFIFLPVSSLPLNYYFACPTSNYTQAKLSTQNLMIWLSVVEYSHKNWLGSLF